MTSGSTALTPASYTNLMVGETLAATGIPAGTTIHSCNGGVTTIGTVCTASIVLSANATATVAAGVPSTSLTVSSIPLASTKYPIDGTHGAEFDGTAANDFVGFSVASGDVNGDGIPDLIIGANQATEGGHTKAGAVYVVFGKTGAWTNKTTLTSTVNPLDGTHGAEFDGAVASDYVSLGGVAAGDVNGDGISDLIMGSWHAYEGGVPIAGAVYVVFGKTGAWTNKTTLTSTVNPLDGTHGAEFGGDGYVVATVGSSVAAGDVNGDGIADLMIGAMLGGSTYGGAGYVVFGHSSSSYAWTNQTTLTPGSNPLDGVHGAEFDDAVGGDNMGTSIASGDVNGDGISDIITGAPRTTVGSNSNAGAVSVIFGHKNTTNNPWPTTAYSLGGL